MSHIPSLDLIWTERLVCVIGEELLESGRILSDSGLQDDVVQFYPARLPWQYSKQRRPISSSFLRWGRLQRLQERFSHRYPASWRTTGALIGQCIDAYDDGSVVKCVTVAALGVFDIGTSALAVKVGELAQRRLEQLRARNHKNMERSKIESDFYPIGNYVFMEQDSNPWGDKETRYIRHYVNDESVKMQWKLGEVKLGIADVQYHEIASYRSVMAATSLIDGPKFYSPVPEPPYEVNLVVSTPAPTVSANDVWSS